VSALAQVRCAGAPRDLGLDQGAAARDAIRAVLWSAALREWLPGSRSRRAWRDLASYFPHHAERMQGLALGARVPEHALAARLGELLEGDLGLAAAVSGERAAGALVARSFGPGPAGDLLVRHSAPDNGHRSLELAPAWSAAAAIGVNEHGLAATATALPPADALLSGCAAPALLLVQDVLQRFDAVDKAVEWALRRPAGGRASLLLADATGYVAAVGIEGRARRMLGEGEPFLAGLAPASAAAALAKGAAESRALDAAALARLLAEAQGEPALVAIADPAGRRLAVAREGTALAWHALEARQRSRGRAARPASALID
jgi:hypothetical protein